MSFLQISKRTYAGNLRQVIAFCNQNAFFLTTHKIVINKHKRSCTLYTHLYRHLHYIVEFNSTLKYATSTCTALKMALFNTTQKFEIQFSNSSPSMINLILYEHEIIKFTVNLDYYTIKRFPFFLDM